MKSCLAAQNSGPEKVPCPRWASLVRLQAGLHPRTVAGEGSASNHPPAAAPAERHNRPAGIAELPDKQSRKKPAIWKVAASNTCSFMQPCSR